jgi:hypothetical protein
VPELDLDALLTATEAARYARVSVSCICKWYERGHLPAATDADGKEIRDVNNRRQYRLLDVAKAENKTRQAAAVMAQRLAARAAA